MENNLQHLTREVLEKGYLLTIAVQDNDGVWAADVIYIYDDAFNLYWMSTPERRHSMAIDSGHNQIAGAIAVTQGPDEPDEGLQLSGLATRVDDPSPELLERWMKKKVKVYSADMGTVLDEHVWYKLVPDQIELIYQKVFEYKRQKVR